jgi:hypothetical protein
MSKPEKPLQLRCARCQSLIARPPVPVLKAKKREKNSFALCNECYNDVLRIFGRKARLR